MNTIQGYYEDPYLREFEAKVVKIIEIDDQYGALILDKTYFYPRGGGACGDIGLINRVNIDEVIVDKSTGAILHPIRKDETGKFTVDIKVNCLIDWDRRYKVMKLHCASHIMEHFLFELVDGLELVGTNVNDTRDSSTYVGPQITDDQIIKLNSLSNEFIERDYSILCYSDPENPSYRFWECNGIKIPCGGVHPRNTGEIGNIAIRKEKGGKRQKIRTELAK